MTSRSAHAPHRLKEVEDCRMNGKKTKRLESTVIRRERRVTKGSPLIFLRRCRYRLMVIVDYSRLRLTFIYRESKIFCRLSVFAALWHLKPSFRFLR